MFPYATSAALFSVALFVALFDLISSSKSEMGAKRKAPSAASVGATSGAASSSMAVPPGEVGGAEDGGALPDGGQPKKQRRQLQRRSSDAVVDRAIEEHFQHLSAYERATMQVGGLTLR